MADRKIFESTYLKYYPVLLVYGKTMTKNEQLIEDTIQDLFTILWEKWDQLAFKTSFENYLFISFRNNLIRKVKAQPVTLELNSTHGIPREEISNHDREHSLKHFIELLPRRQKEVLFLRYYKNKSYQGIAEHLGIQYQVARNFSYRAITSLKKKMKKLYPKGTG